LGIIYKTTDNWGIQRSGKKKIALRATVKPETVNKSVETLPWELVV
jgi:hypothetical protein